MKYLSTLFITLLLPSSLKAGSPEPPLRDKTLVVWVALADLTQHGGSALTIDDGKSKFDGLVFGELAAGKWMAGSELFSRTQKAQAAFPAEQADTSTFVQMALVYEGRQVTAYRNGQRYSQHEMGAEPAEFGPRSVVMLGRRHRQQADNAHLGGAIDDARIYDRVLTPGQLQTLTANQPSDPPPWAWWTFNDAAVKEMTGRFLISQLVGGAKIENGKLLLDGQSGELQAKSGKAIPFAMETPTRPAQPPADWLTFHLAHPGPGEGMPGDPNCAFFWKGRYHLHYIYRHDDSFAFAHVSSPDMLHWQWHPTTLTPSSTGHGMYSGTGFFTKEGRPAIIYHGEGSGRNQVAIAQDDNLEKWSQPIAIEPRVRADQDGSKIANWDPDAWIDAGHYYALSGGNPGSGKPPTLFKSDDLQHWDYQGLFLTHDMPDVQPTEDISCPNFFKLGGKDMLLCISHTLGCRYYLGEWKDEKFTPTAHARMNWNAWDFFAPESLLTADGRRVMWAWCNLGSPQTGIQSLPRELSLAPDGTLRIQPLRELATLRTEEQTLPSLTAPATLATTASDAAEFQLTLESASTKPYGVTFNGLTISLDPTRQTLSLGNTHAPFNLKSGEPLTLRIFIDKSMVEVFANDCQALVGSHQFPSEKRVLSLFTEAGAVRMRDAKQWKMKSIYAAP
jgi:beta-fructofuranosidase